MTTNHLRQLTKIRNYSNDRVALRRGREEEGWKREGERENGRVGGGKREEDSESVTQQ